MKEEIKRIKEILRKQKRKNGTTIGRKQRIRSIGKNWLQ